MRTIALTCNMLYGSPNWRRIAAPEARHCSPAGAACQGFSARPDRRSRLPSCLPTVTALKNEMTANEHGILRGHVIAYFIHDLCRCEWPLPGIRERHLRSVCRKYRQRLPLTAGQNKFRSGSGQFLNGGGQVRRQYAAVAVDK